MKKQSVIFYGGDYNPDQWPEKIHEEDMRLLKKAHMNIVTLPVFSWAKLQPSEDEFCFTWLDKILDKLAQNGIKACLATPTAAQPAWMSKKYPDILPVDILGRKRTHGKRVNICPNSESYRRFSRRMAEEMAKRYAHHPALALWHISNEYGTYCYCGHCEKKFRAWLKGRYKTVENLNDRWNLAFWGHTVYDWDEIVLPTDLNDDDKFYQPKYLDYLKFMTDSTIEAFNNEYEAIRRYSPDIPATTNISGFIKTLDQFEFCKHVDIVGWDNYPWPTDMPDFIALKHDIMRGLKGGKPFLMVEQSPNQQNWQPYNKLKRPGEVRMLSYQALAHGADSAMFFQIRQSLSGVEKLHGAVISHAGHENTRVFRECEQLGRELAQIGGRIVGGVTEAKAAIIFDWHNWWAVELSSGPSRDLKYMDIISRYYKAFHRLNIAVDFVSTAGDISKYDLVAAPLMYMVNNDMDKKLSEFVKDGGTCLVGFFSGIVDENDKVFQGGYPGKLSDMLGIWVEENDALLPGESNGIKMLSAFGSTQGTYKCTLLCDIIHTVTAEALAVYESDFYAGTPCVTSNRYGRGEAYYIGCNAEQEFINDFVRDLCDKARLAPVIKASQGIEATVRKNENGSFLFLLNHNKEDAGAELDGRYIDVFTGAELEGEISVKANDIKILARK